MRSFLGLLHLGSWSLLRRCSTPFGRRGPAPAGSAAEPTRRPRILVVTPYSIHPVIHGGAVRISNLIRRMARANDVSLLVLGGGTDDPEHRGAYEGICERVFFHRLPDRFEVTHDPWHLMPPSSLRFSHPTVTDRISALVDAHAFDIVQLEFAELGAHVRRLDRARTVLVEHDLGFKTQQRQRALEFGRRFDADERVGSGVVDGLRQKRFEILACEAADQVHCMSDEDRKILASQLWSSAHLRVIPNGVDTEIFQSGPAENRRGALFLGSFPHLPNLDAFEHLVNEIWPAIRRRQPDATLTVAGARPPEQVLTWDGRDGIRVVGEVDEVAPLYRDHRVLVVPLRAGSGTRLKILEALASGLPVVSTTIGAEGLNLSAPPKVVIADSPEEMATEVASMLTAADETIEAIGRRGRSFVKATFDWDLIARDLRRAHTELMSPAPPAKTPTITSVDPPTADDRPAVSVVIPTSAEDGPSVGLLDGLAEQDFDQTVEVVCVDLDSPQETLERWRGSKIRVVSVCGPQPNQGVVINAGAAAARGRILVFTSAHAIPADDRWLARLVAPFDHDDAPAAVQGGITAQLLDGAPAHNPSFTRESVGWREAYGGLEFSTVNAAMPRKVWEQYPFPPRVLLADRAWQRIAADHELLILPCLAAAVRYVRQDTAGDLVRASMDEGRAWRSLGIRYTALECWADAVHARPLIGEGGEPTAAVARGHKIFRIFRPIGIYLGNRFTTP